EVLLSDELVILPLTWGPVTAHRNGSGVTVQWTTHQETSVDYFVVERSSDGRNWTNIGQQVKANNNSQQQYSLLDTDAPAQRLYYRIQQFDFDGRSTHSSIVTVSDEFSSLQMALYPNPTTDNFR